MGEKASESEICKDQVSRRPSLTMPALRCVRCILCIITRSHYPTEREKGDNATTFSPTWKKNKATWRSWFLTWDLELCFSIKYYLVSNFSDAEHSLGHKLPTQKFISIEWKRVSYIEKWLSADSVLEWKSNSLWTTFNHRELLLTSVMVS